MKAQLALSNELQVSLKAFSPELLWQWEGVRGCLKRAVKRTSEKSSLLLGTFSRSSRMLKSITD